MTETQNKKNEMLHELMHEIKPLMMEYALWWQKNVRCSEISDHYSIKGRWTMCYKKEQVLEMFLKTKSPDY
jgi:hypothetical protein